MPDLLVKHVAVTLESGDSLAIPYWEVTTGTPGPVLLITAAQHGNEIHGSEALRRFVLRAASELSCGSIRGVPFTNLLAVRRRRHHDTQGPEEPVAMQPERNTNLLWPGDPEGNDIARLVHAIYAQCGADATHGVDIHCWCRFWAAACLPRRDRPRSWELAKISALPFARPNDGWAPGVTPPVPTLMGAYFNDTGRASLTFESAGQYIVTEKEVRLAERCVLNVARFIGMMPGEPEGTDEGPTWWAPERLVEVTALATGLFVEAGLEPGDWVQEGQPLGHLIRESDLETIPFVAPAAGRLEAYGCHRRDCDVSLAAMHPWAEPGELLARIVRDGPELEHA